MFKILNFSFKSIENTYHSIPSHSFTLKLSVWVHWSWQWNHKRTLSLPTILVLYLWVVLLLDFHKVSYLRQTFDKSVKVIGPRLNHIRLLYISLYSQYCEVTSCRSILNCQYFSARGKLKLNFSLPVCCSTGWLFLPIVPVACSGSHSLWPIAFQNNQQIVHLIQPCFA